MFSKTAATLAAAALFAAVPTTASASTSDDRDARIMDAVITSNDFAGMRSYNYGMVEIDVLKNDLPIETTLSKVEILIDGQPWGGHHVKVMPADYPGDHQTIMFAVNDRDVTGFVGTQFTYRVKTETGSVSAPATVLVAPVRY